ncbi:MAG: hypothetical protein P8X50_17435, partial [Maritimibacter sp.]
MDRCELGAISITNFRCFRADAEPTIQDCALVQRHGNKDLWLNPPPIPLTTKELTKNACCNLSESFESNLPPNPYRP